MKIVGVKFNGDGRVYYFNPNGLNLKNNITVVVNTDRGLRFGKVVDLKEYNVDNDDFLEVVRIASKKDFQQNLRNIQEEKIALDKCRKLADKYDLNMNIILIRVS